MGTEACDHCGAQVARSADRCAACGGLNARHALRMIPVMAAVTVGAMALVRWQLPWVPDWVYLSIAIAGLLAWGSMGQR